MMALTIWASENSLGQSLVTVGGGTNNRVSAMTVYNGELYAGGWFTTAGGSTANYIAKWNGTTWIPLGAGVGNHVNALAVYNGELYVGGDFQNAGGSGNPAYYLAKWNGTSWSAVSGGTSGPVNALVVYDGELYIGGDFIYANGIMVYNLTKWNGSTFSVCGMPSDYVTSLGVFNNELYAGGNFSTIGGITSWYIAKYNGTNWTSVGGVIWTGTPLVYAFSPYNSSMVVGGSFYSVNYVSKWNGSTWSGLGGGTNNIVYALFTFNNELYAGGTFTNAGGTAANRIAKWNGTTWSAVSTGLNYTVYSFASYNSELYVGGEFSSFIVKLNCPSSSAIINPNSCNTYSSPSGNYTWTNSGTYSDTLTNVGGCDSVITINLTINSVNNSATQNGATLTASANGSTYQWLDCNNSFAQINGATNQSFTATVNGNYSVAVSQNGCTDTSICFSVTGVGINEINSVNNFQIFPNPASDNLTIQLSQLCDNCRIEILNLFGQLLLSETANEKTQTLNINSLSEGVYLIQIQTPYFTEIKKLTIVK